MNPEDKKIRGAAVADILAQARGRDHALTSGEIAMRLRDSGAEARCDSRGVRAIISELQDRWPFIVCAAPGGGYFVPADFDEVRAYFLFLSTLESAAIAKRKALQKKAKQQGYPL